MTLSIEHDRAAQFLMAHGAAVDFRAAQGRLEAAALEISYEDADEPWVQAALLAAAAAGGRMFRGGVFLVEGSDARGVLALHPAGGLRCRLAAAGVRLQPAPAGAARLHVGPNVRPGAELYCWTEGWTAVTSPVPATLPAPAGNVISGVLAVSIALAETFRRLVLRDLRAGRLTRRLTAWGPQQPDNPTIRYTPKSVWMLGVGNLGQAALFVLGLLPWTDPAQTTLLLQDFDRAGPENLPVQILTGHDWIGQRKVRPAAAYAERLGFQTVLVESAFHADGGPAGDDPRVLLCGVDNLDARRWAAAAGFDLAIDAGLGATAADAFDLRLHAFPGGRSPLQAWPDLTSGPAEPVLNAGLQKALEEGQLDLCGALTIAGKSVGVPCTALAAAALQVGQLVRALATGRCCDLVDASLAGSQAVMRPMDEPLKADLAFEPAFIV